MESGRIIKTGGKELALELENRGYDWVVAEDKATRGVALSSVR
jgi:Fe-S cluster assembly ATP-binding protein